MKKMGQHVYSREARLKPAELYCVNLIQETYKCNKCTNSNGSDVLISSKMPQSLLPHSYFSSVNTDLKLSEITGLKMYFFTGLNAVLYGKQSITVRLALATPDLLY